MVGNLEELKEYTPFYRALNEPRYIRRDFLEKIKDVFKVDWVISYISPSRPIDDVDPIVFQDILYHIKGKVESMLLILHSNGGSPDVAEKLVEIMRDTSKHLYVVIPEKAKSAATILSLGADKIYMLENAELGPIDPQIRLKEDLWRPAQSIVDGVFGLISLLEGKDQINPGIAILLQHIDPATIDFAFKTIERAKTLAARLIENYMLKGEKEKAIEIAETLSKVSEHLSHGRPIRWREAEEIGLVVDRIPRENEEHDLIWRYFAYALVYMGDTGKHKLFESPKASIALPPNR